MLPLCPSQVSSPLLSSERLLQIYSDAAGTTALQICPHRTTLPPATWLRMDLQDICTECGGCDLLHVPVEVALNP